MKLNKLYIACGALFFGTAALTGCSDDEGYDIDADNSNLIYVDQSVAKVAECTVYHTPVGSFGDIQASINTRLQYPSADSITITATPDTTLVSEYNGTYNSTAATVPAAVLAAMEFEPTGVKAGTTVATDPLRVTIPAAVCDQLTAADYVVPMRLAAVKETNLDNERPVVPSQSMGVYYLAIHTTSDVVGLTGNNTARCSIVRTPVGVFGGINASFNVSMNVVLDSEVKVSATVDNSLVNTYNTENNQNYKALPSNVTNALTVNAATIAAGARSASLSVSVPNELGQSLTEKGYVLPLRLVAEYSDGTKVTLDKSVAYVVVTTEESLIQDEPESLLGTKATNISAWSCVQAVNYNKDELKLSNWKFSQMRISDASFVVDLGATHKVSAFYVNCDPMQSYRVYLSEDNATWTDLGDPSGKGTYRENWSTSWYVLYGGVPARYVKIEQKLDAGSWGWDYGDYSWGLSYVSTTWGLCFDD